MTKINTFRYLFFNLLAVAMVLFFTHNLKEVLVVLFFSAATVGNHFLLCKGVAALSTQTGPIASKKRLAFFFIAKLIILLGALGLGVHFIGDRIILAVICYIVQLVALGIGLKWGINDET